jgi:uncharacterized membrane protein
MMNFIRYHWRLFVAVASGLAAGLAATLGDRFVGAPLLIGWNVGAAIFVVTTGWLFLRAGEAEVSKSAHREDESRLTLTFIVLGAVGASLAAALFALHGSKTLTNAPVGERSWVLALSAATLVLSWMVVQSLFVLHYAHRYFGDSDRNGTIDGGVTFPGEPPKTYRDFIYVAVCVGATCQVSDFSITTSKFRGLVTLHAIFAFCFNTMILALGINIIAGLLGQ